jgi:hypothetical protein
VEGNDTMVKDLNGIVIEGPVENGFFIRDGSNNVWDGECWRGFGAPLFFKTFPVAFKGLRLAKAAIPTN